MDIVRFLVFGGNDLLYLPVQCPLPDAARYMFCGYLHIGHNRFGRGEDSGIDPLQDIAYVVRSGGDIGIIDIAVAMGFDRDDLGCIKVICDR